MAAGCVNDVPYKAGSDQNKLVHTTSKDANQDLRPTVEAWAFLIDSALTSRMLRTRTATPVLPSFGYEP